MVRWPGKIKAGVVSNEIMSNLDWLPTFLAAAGEPDVAEKLLKGHQAAGKTFKVHLDGYNFLPYLTGQEKKGPRDRYFYFSDDGNLLAMRYQNWKVHFMVQDQAGTLEIWQRQFRGLRSPYLFNLRTDPYEQATITSNTYWDWYFDRSFALYALPDVVGEFLATFEEFPPRQKAASFTIDKALEMLQKPHGGK
jgi:arylsulfatase